MRRHSYILEDLNVKISRGLTRQK